jgi:phosphatidylserine/phosphatidylglycerophosphate/cardiolipin synthase-like enzyme
MAKFLNAKQSLGEIERIISNAKSTIVMISPYIKINDDLIQRLKDAGELRRVNVLMVCRKRDLNLVEREKLGAIHNLSLCFNERVHAKCFFNEDTMVITSLNLYDSSLGDNREMGVLLKNTIEGDKEAFEEAKNEAKFIIRECQSDTSRLKLQQLKVEQIPQMKAEHKSSNAIKIRTEKKDGSIFKEISKFFGFDDLEDNNGYCIRCGKTIIFNIDAPLCRNCYQQWNKYKDATYLENFCNKCGNSADTSKEHPLCYSCYKKYIS